MRELYTDETLNGIRGQLKKRTTVIVIIAAVFAAVGIWSFISRIQWLTVAAFIVAGAVIIFGVEMFCLPLRRYSKLLETALHGRTHTGDFIFDHLEPDESLVDGVPCLSMVFLGDPDKHGTRDQMFYWDRELALPQFTKGQTVTLHYTGKNIIGFSAG